MPDIRWWTLGVLKEGVAHLILATAIWLVVWWLAGTDAASWFTMAWFLSREARDWEIEALPNLMHALGFLDWQGLRPCTSWNLKALRHSLAGWVPVTLVCVILILVL